MKKRDKEHIDARLSQLKDTGAVFTDKDIKEYLQNSGYSYVPTSREAGQYLKGRAKSLGCEYTNHGYISYWRME